MLAVAGKLIESDRDKIALKSLISFNTKLTKIENESINEAANGKNNLVLAHLSSLDYLSLKDAYKNALDDFNLMLSDKKEQLSLLQHNSNKKLLRTVGSITLIIIFIWVLEMDPEIWTA